MVLGGAAQMQGRQGGAERLGVQDKEAWDKEAWDKEAWRLGTKRLGQGRKETLGACGVQLWTEMV